MESIISLVYCRRQMKMINRLKLTSRTEWIVRPCLRFLRTSVSPNKLSLNEFENIGSSISFEDGNSIFFDGNNWPRRWIFSFHVCSMILVRFLFSKQFHVKMSDEEEMLDWKKAEKGKKKHAINQTVLDDDHRLTRKEIFSFRRWWLGKPSVEIVISKNARKSELSLMIKWCEWEEEEQKRRRRRKKNIRFSFPLISSFFSMKKRKKKLEMSRWIIDR